MLSGCPILAALATKARELGHLEGCERQTVIEALGFLPEAGRLDAIRWVLHRSAGSGRSAVDRRLRSLHRSPISCAGIRRRHPGLTTRVQCSCRFQRLWGGVYPTPVLHTLRPEQIAEFKDRRSAYRARRAARRKPAEADQPGETTKTETKMNDCTPDNPSVESGIVEAGAGQEVDALLAKLKDLRARAARLDRELRETTIALSQLFDEAGVDRLEAAGGCLVRLTADPPRFALEV